MKHKIFCLLLLLTATLHASIPTAVEATEARFSEERVRKGKVMLSEILGEGANLHRDTRIKFSKAIRFDAKYRPQDGGKPIDLPAAEIRAHVKRAHEVLKFVRENEAFVNILNGKDFALPCGIEKQVGNQRVVVCLDSIVFTPTYAYAVVYAIIEDTKNGDSLCFWGKDIRLTREGGFTGDARLELLETYPLKMGGKITVNFLVDPQYREHENYLIFDCNGFKRLHVDARIDFSRELLLPDRNGEPAPEGIVSTEFMTEIESFDNWIVQVGNMPAFQIKGLEGFTWQIGALALDFNNIANPADMYFPPGYTSTDFIGNDQLPWQGFFAKNITITFPEEFKFRADTRRRIIANLAYGIIDRYGFSGKAELGNLLPLGEGEMGEWDFSVDYLSLELKKNTPTAAAFNGRLVMPVSDNTQVLNLSGSIQPNHNYRISVRTESSMQWNIFGKATVRIDPNSSILVVVSNKQFVARALLNGSFDVKAEINGDNGSNNTADRNNIIQLDGATFQNLVIQSTRPYVGLGPNGHIGFQFCIPQMAAFPVELTGLGLVTDSDGRLGLSVTILLKLLGPSDPGTFAPKATVVIFNERTLQGRWQYYRTRLDLIRIDADISSVHIVGELEFFRSDPVYGSGFKAYARVSLECFNSLGFEANVMFGKKTEGEVFFRYWYVDATVTLPAKTVMLIPPLPVLFLSRIGAGAYYRMAPTVTPISSTLVTTNGVGYVPSARMGLGLKAMFGIEGPDKRLLNGDLGIEVSFDGEGTLNAVIFSGMVECMSMYAGTDMAGISNKYKSLQKSNSLFEQQGQPTNSTEVNNEIDKRSGGIMAKWVMIYNHVQRDFTANVDVYVNLYGGIIKGTEAANKAGSMNVYFGPSNWFMHVGTPDKPIHVLIAEILKPSAYFVTGKNIPAPKGINGQTMSFPGSAHEQAGMGTGFGFGVRAEVDKTVGSNFRVYVRGAVGGDFYLYNNGEVYCKSTKENRGIKNWYAFGQAFAYVSAGVRWSGCFRAPGPTCNCGGCITLCCRWWCGCEEICGPYLCCWQMRDYCVTKPKTWDKTLSKSCVFEGVKPTSFMFEFKNPVKSFDITVGKQCEE